jgi:hypothetical protein
MRVGGGRHLMLLPSALPGQVEHPADGRRQRLVLVRFING